MLAYIDQHGFHMPTFPELLALKKAEFRAIFGEDVYLEPDSQEGQMLAMFAQAEFDCYQLAGAVYNSFSPQTAQGAGLSRMVKINGLARQRASHSSVDVTLVGTAGTTINSGMVKDTAGQCWMLPRVVVIPATGCITVTARAKAAGAVQAAAGEITSIATPTLGWQSVTNGAAATPGQPLETDAALRQRQHKSTALPSRTVLDGIVGAVANLPGVKHQKVYENDTDTPNEYGMPGHSIAVVVDGGDAKGVARAIANKKTPGAQTLGNTTVTIADSQGMPCKIRFYRCEHIALTLAVTIKARPGYISSTGDAIKTGLAEYLAGLEIGEEVLLSKLYTPINAAEPEPASKTFDVISIEIARVGDTLTTDNLSIPFTALACLDKADIHLAVLGD